MLGSKGGKQPWRVKVNIYGGKKVVFILIHYLCFLPKLLSESERGGKEGSWGTYRKVQEGYFVYIRV